MNSPTTTDPEIQDNTQSPSTIFNTQSELPISSPPKLANTTSPKLEMRDNEKNTKKDLGNYDELEVAMNKLDLNNIADKNIIDSSGSDVSKLIEELDLESLIDDIHSKTQTQKQETVDYQQSSIAAKVLEKNNKAENLSQFYAAFEDLQLQALSSVSNAGAETFSRPSTLVVLSPDSYKHVFSRSWYSKSYKASVVERPERLLATSIGIGAAFAQHPAKFALRQTSKCVDLRTSSSVTKIHGPDWAKQLYLLCEASEGKLAQKEVEVPENWHSGDIYLAPGTIKAVEGTVGAIEDAVDALFGNTGDGTDEFENVFVAGRPPGHHSHTCQPSGFCLINNAHIAIQYAAEKYGVTHAVVLDFDLHHGDGTQDICWKLSGLDNEESDQGEAEDDVNTECTTDTRAQEATKPALSNIGYFSLHDINSFPTETGYASVSNIKDASVCVMAHDMCVWNVHLEKFTTEAEFMELYDTKYSALFVKAHEYLQHCHRAHDAEQKAAIVTATKHKPVDRHGKSKTATSTTEDFTASNSSSGKNDENVSTSVPFNPIIILSAGFDASEYENVNMRRHGVQVPNSFYHRFTRDAKALARAHSDGAKVLSLLEGGYSDGALSAGVYSHLTGFASASETAKSTHAGIGDTGIEHYLSPSRNNAAVTKMMEQGCKLKWDASRTIAAYKRRPTSSGIHLAESDCRWLAQGIGLGRLLWPLEFRQPAAAVSAAAGDTQTKKLVKEVGDLVKDFEELDVGDRLLPMTDNVSDPDVRMAGKRILRNRSHLHKNKEL